ncbi:MAG: ABC transporter permease, partial [Verrucomicrobia bacterium]|nr:ABC transporter permease [Verrucomicrobiota bacterium]
ISILRRELMDFLKAGNRTMAGSISKHRLHAVFVISQVSLSVILLITAGVLVRNLNAVLQKDVGFQREGRIAFKIPQPSYRFGEGDNAYQYEVLPFQERVLERIRSQPGVIGASASNRVPISGDNLSYRDFAMHHYEYANGEPRANALRVITLPGYFETVGTKILFGRDFQNTDTFDSEPIVIISQNTMERYYQDLDPVGMSINFRGKDLKIVGVAEQVQDKPFFLESDGYTLYFPFKAVTHERGLTNYVVHVNGDPVQQMANIERAILDMDPKLSIKSVTFDDVYDLATFAQKLPMVVTVIFSSIALFLSGLGLYGLISFTVAERTKEYGIRMALGAGRGNILKRVIGGSGRLIGWGLVVGLVVSITLCVQINPMLSDINTVHPTTFVMVIGFVIAICVFASFFPAQRATRINITETLQY